MVSHATSVSRASIARYLEDTKSVLSQRGLNVHRRPTGGSRSVATSTVGSTLPATRYTVNLAEDKEDAQTTVGF